MEMFLVPMEGATMTRHATEMTARGNQGSDHSDEMGNWTTDVGRSKVCMSWNTSPIINPCTKNS